MTSSSSNCSNGRSTAAANRGAFSFDNPVVTSSASATAMMTSAVASSNAEVLRSLLKETILRVDGIICIQGDDFPEVVVKIHERLQNKRDDVRYGGGGNEDVEQTEDDLPDGLPEGTVVVMPEAPPDEDDKGQVEKKLLQPPSSWSDDAMFNGSVASRSPPMERMRTPEQPAADEKGFSSSTPFGLRTSLLERFRPLTPGTSPLNSAYDTPQCRSCSYTFSSVELLKDHNEAAHGVFTCSHCYRTFTSKSNLARHTMLHTGRKPYVCATCGKAFARKDHLTNHAVKHSYKCASCHKRFEDKEALRNHFRHDHASSLTDVCEQCNKGFDQTSLFLEHKKVHPQNILGRSSSGGAPGDGGLTAAEELSQQQLAYFMCSYCNFTCENRLQHRKHLLLHESTQAKLYRCKGCDKVFKDPMMFSNHLSSHSDDTGAIFECCFCDDVFHTYSDLRLHEETHCDDMEANGDADDWDGVVAKEGRQSEERSTPVIEGSGGVLIVDNPTPVIEISRDLDEASPGSSSSSSSSTGCSSSRTAASSAVAAAAGDGDQFLSIKSGGNEYPVPIPQGPFTCPHCPTKLAAFKDLEAHCFGEHNRFPCMYCSKTFAQKANRDRHVCIHTGEKPFSCADCGQKFARGDKLKLHRIRYHNADVKERKPYASQFSDASFSSSFADNRSSPLTPSMKAVDARASLAATDTWLGKREPSDWFERAGSGGGGGNHPVFPEPTSRDASMASPEQLASQMALWRAAGSIGLRYPVLSPVSLAAVMTSSRVSGGGPDFHLNHDGAMDLSRMDEPQNNNDSGFGSPGNKALWRPVPLSNNNAGSLGTAAAASASTTRVDGVTSPASLKRTPSCEDAVNLSQSGTITNGLSSA